MKSLGTSKFTLFAYSLVYSRQKYPHVDLDLKPTSWVPWLTIQELCESNKSLPVRPAKIKKEGDEYCLSPGVTPDCE